MSEYYTPTPVIPQGRNVEVDTIVETAWGENHPVQRRVTAIVPERFVHLFSEDAEIQTIPVIVETSG